MIFEQKKIKKMHKPCIIKAIGGSGSKDQCWVYLKDLHEGEQRLFTEYQN